MGFESWAQSRYSKSGSNKNLPPKFRFHSPDEELIAHYFLEKVLNNNFTGRVIANVDIKKIDNRMRYQFCPIGYHIVHEYTYRCLNKY